MSCASGKRKNGAGKEKIYCYTLVEGDVDWDLFTPNLEPATAWVTSEDELREQEIRIRVFKRYAEKVLCVYLSGKIPKKLTNLGPDPKAEELKKFGAKVYKLIEL